MRILFDHMVEVARLCELPLALTMPPSKVCLQCKAIIPMRQKVCKSCEHVFRAKRTQKSRAYANPRMHYIKCHIYVRDGFKLAARFIAVQTYFKPSGRVKSGPDGFKAVGANKRG